MAARLWKILIFKCVLFFPKCLRILVDISEDVPVFLKSISNTSQQDFICHDFSLHSFVELNVMTSCPYLWSSPSFLYPMHYVTYCSPGCQAHHFDSIWQYCVLLKSVIHFNFLAHFKDLCCRFSVSYFLRN